MDHKKALELQKSVLNKRKEVDELEKQLMRSLTLTEVFGEYIWNYGKVTTQVIGDPSSRMLFTIHMGGNGHHSVDLQVVPVVLWPNDVKVDILNTYGYQTEYLQSLIKKIKEYDNEDQN